MGCSNLKYSQQKLDYMATRLVPEFENAQKVGVIITTGKVRDSHFHATHLARYDWRKGWTTLCARNYDLTSHMAMGVDDVTCLRCEPLMHLVKHVPVTRGTIEPDECGYKLF